MYQNWRTEHLVLARREFAKIYDNTEKRRRTSLPTAPSDFLEFIEAAKPMAEGKMRRFPLLTFWNEIYKDQHSFKMIVGGRQIHKTTYVTDLLAHEAITKPGTQLGYVTFNQANLTSFSRQKLLASLQQNRILAPYLRTANVKEVSFKNGSKIYSTISNNRYRNIEGKSLNHVILDEAQYQPMESAQRVIQTMSATNGNLTICGIGGEAGTPYERFWKNSNQCQFVFDDPDWRKKLQFDENGLFEGRYLDDIMSGRWLAQSPENTICHGYHLSQIMFPRIPRTMDEAIRDYKINPMYSIEYQEKNNGQTFVITNVLGEFYKSVGRPVTPEMVLSCMNRYMELLSPDEIAEIKYDYGEKVRIAMGVDFGSGNSSDTVIAIIIEWRLNKGLSRYTLAAIEKRPPEDQMEQAEYILRLFENSGCDIGVGDLGYGANQVKFIQDGGYSPSTGEKIEGASSKKFRGCRTIGNESKPIETHPEKRDEHGDTTATVNIDKNVSIQKLIDIFGRRVPHPLRPEEKNLWVPKLAIPYATEHRVDYLTVDMTKITRKDILDEDEVDPRQVAKREFNHPPDSAMAIIYALTALETKPPPIWMGGPLGFPDWSEYYIYWRDGE